MPWCDDVSGNVSKQFNPHTNIYIVNASLPHEHLVQEYFIRFSSTSPHASSCEQMTALMRNLCVSERQSMLITDCEVEKKIHGIWHMIAFWNRRSCSGYYLTFSLRTIHSRPSRRRISVSMEITIVVTTWSVARDSSERRMKDMLLISRCVSSSSTS